MARLAGPRITGHRLQIAAIALRDSMSVATGNTKDFSGLGIDLINPLSDAE
jgi:predicted nucleic acid-binding protein